MRRRARIPPGQPPETALLLTPPVTPITSVPLRWHCCALFGRGRIAIVPIELDVGSSPEGQRGCGRSWIWGVYMRKMNLFYAAIGFAVARWIFKRQAVVDPVTRFRSQGLL